VHRYQLRFNEFAVALALTNASTSHAQGFPFSQRGSVSQTVVAGRWIDTYGGVTSQARAMLHRAAEGLTLSARGYHRVLKVARTIADLDESNSVQVPHVAEALRYRQPHA